MLRRNPDLCCFWVFHGRSHYLQVLAFADCAPSWRSPVNVRRASSTHAVGTGKAPVVSRAASPITDRSKISGQRPPEKGLFGPAPVHGSATVQVPDHRPLRPTPARGGVSIVRRLCIIFRHSFPKLWSVALVASMVSTASTAQTYSATRYLTRYGWIAPASPPGGELVAPQSPLWGCSKCRGRTALAPKVSGNEASHPTEPNGR